MILDSLMLVMSVSFAVWAHITKQEGWAFWFGILSVFWLASLGHSTGLY